MKAFPHQFNDLDKLTASLELFGIMKSNGRDVESDKEFGSELAMSGIYSFRNLTTSVEDRLQLEMQKPPANQGFRTAARDLRRFFRLTGLVDHTLTPTNRGNEILAAKETEDLRNVLWRQAMIDLRLEADGKVSHPYRILLKLIGNHPGIQTKKLLLAFVARDDSPKEFERISSMVPLSFNEILEKTGVTKSSAANAVKILPSIAEQVGDIRRGNKCSLKATKLPSEDGTIDLSDSDAIPTYGEFLTEVTPEDISKVPQFQERYTDGTFDLSASNEIRKNRTVQHHKAVKSIARLIADNGFRLFENPYDCLGYKEKVGSLLVEVKTLDSTPADEYRQSVKALGQLKFYKHFHVCEEMKGPTSVDVVAYSHTPSVSTMRFMEANEITSVWSNDGYWFTADGAGATVSLSPLVLLDAAGLH